MNSYRMLEDTRDNIGEATAKHWDDAQIMRKLNSGQRRVVTAMSMTPGDWFVVSKNITPSNSLITLPSDLMKPLYLEEKATGRPIPLTGNVRDRRMSRQPHALYQDYSFNAYLLKDYIEVNVSSYSEQITLWYQQRVPDMHAGEAGADCAASALHFGVGTEPEREDDYYNGLTVEVVSGTGIGIVSEITDYVSSTLIATITGTPTSGDKYGTVSILPRETHDFIVLDATTKLLAKPSSAIDPKYFEFFTAEKRELWRDLKSWLATRKSGSNRTRIVEQD